MAVTSLNLLQKLLLLYTIQTDYTTFTHLLTQLEINISLPLIHASFCISMYIQHSFPFGISERNVNKCQQSVSVLASYIKSMYINVFKQCYPFWISVRNVNKCQQSISIFGFIYHSQISLKLFISKSQEEIVYLC